MFSIRSELRKKLLRYFFTNPPAELYVRELARVLDVDPTNLSKELKRLSSDGLFVASKRGNQTYYRLNREYQLYEETRSVVAKTFGVADALMHALKRVPGIDRALLYGSFARGDEDTASDIDILIVGEPAAERLAMAMQKLEQALGRTIHYVVMSAVELRRRTDSGDAFISDVLRNPRVELLAHEAA